MSQNVELHQGDCLDWLPTLPDQSVDCVITDPPYPEIDRPYGRLTEAEWWALVVDGVIPEVRRILKPTGSAVFILQPNSRKVGSMRGWLFEFQAWACKHWNMVQDAWWWAFDALPQTKNDPNTLRKSVKACVWLGPPDCHRDASEVLWEESERNRAARLSGRFEGASRKRSTRVNVDPARRRTVAGERGGTTPFNLLPVAVGTHNADRGHGAATPGALADWWTRYLCPPGGTVCDPFTGSGTMALAAIERGCSFVGAEKMPEYHETARRRIDSVLSMYPLLSAIA